MDNSTSKAIGQRSVGRREVSSTVAVGEGAQSVSVALSNEASPAVERSSLDKDAISREKSIDMSSIGVKKRIASIKNLTRAVLLKQRKEAIEAGELSEESNVDRRALCGRAPIESGSSVVVKRDDDTGGVYASGLQRCGSVWQPCCACKILPERSRIVDGCYKAHQALGSSDSPNGTLFCTLTQPHRKGATLKEAAKQMAKSWEGLRSSHGFRKLRDRYGFGYIKVTEITYSKVYGWHVHYHILFFLDAWVDEYQKPDEWSLIEDTIMSTWGKQVRKNTGRNISLEAQDLRVVWGHAGIGDYLSKISLEVTRNDRKLAKQDSYSVSELADAAIQGEAWAIAVWCDYLAGTKGMRFSSYSRGLVKRLIDEEPATDEEIAERDHGGIAEGELSMELWRLLHFVADGVAMFMHCWQTSGPEEAIKFFEKQTGITPHASSIEKGLKRWDITPLNKQEFKRLTNGMLVRA